MDCVGCKQAQLAMSNPLTYKEPRDSTGRFRRLLASEVENGMNKKNDEETEKTDAVPSSSLPEDSHESSSLSTPIDQGVNELTNPADVVYPANSQLYSSAEIQKSESSWSFSNINSSQNLSQEKVELKATAIDEYGMPLPGRLEKISHNTTPVQSIPNNLTNQAAESVRRVANRQSFSQPPPPPLNKSAR